MIDVFFAAVAVAATTVAIAVVVAAVTIATVTVAIAVAVTTAIIVAPTDINTVAAPVAATSAASCGGGVGRDCCSQSYVLLLVTAQTLLSMCIYMITCDHTV